MRIHVQYAYTDTEKHKPADTHHKPADKHTLMCVYVCVFWRSLLNAFMMCAGTHVYAYTCYIHLYKYVYVRMYIHVYMSVYS